MNAILLLAAVTTAQVYPYGPEKILPDGDLPECAAARETRSFEAAAAKGEFETVAFVVSSDDDLKSVAFTPGDLTGPDGAKIAAANLDVLVVKEWFRGKTGWTSDRFSGAAAKDRELTPDMLLHDDSLIRLDETPSNRVNYLRIDYASGPRYVDMTRRGRLSPFNDDLHPVRDAATFVPMELAAGRRRQIFVRIHVPRDAAPGDYLGKLAMTVGGVERESFGLALTVHPFELPTPRTHYDSSKVFFGGLYGGPDLGKALRNGKNFANAERKTRAIAKMLAEHNIVYPGGPGEFTDGTSDDPAVRTLRIMREAGMPCDPLFQGGAVDCGWFVGDGNHQTPEQDPAGYTNALVRFGEGSDRQLELCAKVAGHRNRWSTGWDEADVWGCRQQFGFWKRIKDRGGDVVAASGVAEDVNWMLAADHSPATCSWSEAAKWHAGGALVFDYAATFWGPECPDIWRRTQGLRFWFADFDGHFNLGLWCGKNRWNDVVWREDPYRQFGCAYLTIDGAIATVPLEAFREAMDDIRYCSLHRLLAEKAMASADAAVRKSGRAELHWMETRDPERILDLDRFRREVAGRIERLQAMVGPIEVTPPKSSGPLPPDGVAAKLKDTDHFRRALAFKAMDRYDLAIPELAKARAAGASLPAAEFAKLVEAEADLRLEILDRAGAVKMLDDFAARPDLNRALRGRILLKKTLALLTDETFEEVYTRQQLEQASSTLKTALAQPGVAASERLAAIRRMVDACNQGGEPKLAVEIGEYHLAKTAMDEQDKGHLALLVGQGYRDLGDHRKALHYGEQCQRQETAGHWSKDARACLRLIGYSAMALEKWKEACGAWETFLPLVNKEEEKPLYDGVKKLIVDCSAKLRKSAGPATSLDEDPAGGIELDE